MATTNNAARREKTRFHATLWLQIGIRHRDEIEPVIGHSKSDEHLGRDFLKVAVDDAINALLTGVGHKRASN